MDVLGTLLGAVRFEEYTYTRVSDLERLLGETTVGSRRGAVLRIRRPHAHPTCHS